MPLSRGLVAAVLSFALRVPVRAQTAAPVCAPGSASCAPAPADAACSTCAATGSSGGSADKKPAPKAAAASVAGLGAAAGAIDAAGLGRTFDGGRGAEAGAAPGAGSYVPQEAPVSGPQTADTRLSAALNIKMASVLAGSETGRQTLDRMRAADGTLKLPAVVLTNWSGSVLGVYDRYSTPPVMELDQNNVAKAALASVPEKDRPGLARAWRDQSKLSAYLADHPDTLAAVVSQYDCTYVHELTHAWQLRRDRPVDVEVDKDSRGVPREPIDWEIEAFREQMRYYHEKIMRDPTAMRNENSLGSYTAMLTGYDGFHAYVTSLYSGIASGSFPRIEDALARRKNAAGVADMQANESAYAGREKDFIQNELPAIQSDGTARVVALYESAGRPDKALSVLVSAPDEIFKKGGPQAAQATVAYLKSPTPAPIAERLEAWQSYIAYFVKTTGSNVVSDDMFRLHRRDYLDAYNAKIAEARAAKTADARKEALDWAKSYAAFLPPEDQALLRKGGAPKP